MTAITRHRHRRAPRVVLAALLGVVSAGEAWAQDWSLRGRVAQTFSADSNLGLEDDSDTSFGSTTTFSLTGGLRTQRAQWRASSNLRLRFFSGQEDVDLFSPNVRVRGRYSATKRAILTPSLSFRRNNQSFNAFLLSEEPGDDIDPGGDIGDGDIGDGGDGGTGESTGVIVDSDATRTDLNFGSGLSYALSGRSSLSFNGSVALRRFSEDAVNLEESTTIRFNGGYSRRLGDRTSVNVNNGLTVITIDDEENTTAVTLGSTLGVTRSVSPRFRLSASAGPSFTRRTEDNPVTGQSETETSVNGTGRISMNYREGDTRFRLALAQSIAPSDEGDVDLLTRLTFGFTHPLTRDKTFSLTGAVARSTSTFDDGGSGSDLGASISPSINWRVTDDWRANFRYTLRVGSDDDDTNFSNGVFVTLSRPLKLY